jgi:hypothetical protein
LVARSCAVPPSLLVNPIEAKSFRDAPKFMVCASE